MIRSLAALFAVSTVAVAGAAGAQTPSVPTPQLSALMRQDAMLRDRIGRLQLDALLARVDRADLRKSDRRTATVSSERRDLDLYSY